MDAKKLFDKYYSRLAREGILKSLFFSLIIGFVANFVVAAICWYFGWKLGVLWSLLALAVVTGALTPLFYFKKYKPDVKQVAKRLDSLGLKERMITMTEFQTADSFIAQKQREDAKISLHAMSTKKIRFRFSKVMIVFVSITFVLGSTMTTFAGLIDAGIIKPGKEFIETIIPENPANYVTVTYGVAEVIAVADDGYAFVQWSDGIKDPARSDIDIEEDTTIEAQFAPIGDGEGGPGEGEGEGEGEGGAGDEPGKSEKPSDEEGDPNNGANGAYEENNLIYDGTRPYKEYLEEFMCYEDAIAWLESAENVPPELKEYIQTYFNVIV